MGILNRQMGRNQWRREGGVRSLMKRRGPFESFVWLWAHFSFWMDSVFLPAGKDLLPFLLHSWQAFLPSLACLSFPWIYCVLYPLCACSLTVCYVLSQTCLLKFCFFIILQFKSLSCQIIPDSLICSSLLQCFVQTCLHFHLPSWLLFFSPTYLVLPRAQIVLFISVISTSDVAGFLVFVKYWAMLSCYFVGQKREDIDSFIWIKQIHFYFLYSYTEDLRWKFS